MSARSRAMLGPGRNGLSHNDPRKRRTGASGASPIANGWSRTGTLFTLDPSTKISLQAGARNQDDAPSKIYTLMFSLSLSAEARAGGIPECEALVTFSTGGNDVRRRVSVQNGLSISGHAQSTRVVISDATSDAFSSADNPYLVSVLISEGTRPTLPYPPILALAHDAQGGSGLAVPGFSLDFDVPQDAGVGSVMVNVLNNAAIAGGAVASIPEQQANVQHIGLGGTEVLDAYDCRARDWVPISPGTELIRVANGSLAIDMVFTLKWGIDG